MLETIDALFAFAAAAAIAWLLVPVAESLAWRIGAIDRPRERSLHIAPTPKLSGARSSSPSAPPARSSCPGTSRPARS